MAEKGEHTRQLTSADKLPELAQLVMENERLRRKHRKVQHRRDHYARLYYRCQADLDEKKWELHHARVKISELKEQLAALSLPHSTKQDLSGPTSTRSDIGLSLRPLPLHHIAQSHHHSNHTHNLHPQKQQLYHSDPPKLTVPSVPTRPNHIPHQSESDSTSPDSGTSFSPGLGMGVSGADSLLRSHPTSSFSHSREDVPQPLKSKSLPRSMRLEQEEETERTSGIRRTRGYPSDGEKVGGIAGEGTGRVGGEGGKTAGEDWVAWVKERSLLQLDENSVTSSQRHPREGWREGEKRETLENGISDDSAATPCSPVHFQNTTPPSSLASPRARRPTFEPRPPLDHGFSLSQGTSLPHSPLSPSLPHPQRGRKMNGAHPHINFSLSQEAYMSSPLYIRKPAFKESLAATSRKQPRDRTLSEGRRPCQSPLPHNLTPSHNSHPHPLSDSEPEQMLAQSQPQSAFCKPPPVYRQLSHPARLVPPVHYHLPRNQCDIATTTETTHSQHSPPHVSPPQQSPPALPTSSRLPPSFYPPPPPSSHPPTLPPSHSRSHHPHSDTNPTSIHPPPHPMGVATTGMGVANHRSHTLQENPAQHQEEEEVEEETEDEEEEIEGGEERCYQSLGPEQLYKLLLKMADPKCTMTKLEIADSELGDTAAMQQLCKGLRQNTSLKELSLPNNNIGAESLGVLLQHIQHCTNIQELKLRGNDIGKECAPLIKALMEQTSLNSLILTGNEIERHGDILHRALPNDFTMEYDTAEGSVDSGVVVADGDQFNNSSTSLKYLHV